jgi:hypothetical protein
LWAGNLARCALFSAYTPAKDLVIALASRSAIQTSIRGSLSLRKVSSALKGHIEPPMNTDKR